jgi:hypothetical protein
MTTERAIRILAGSMILLSLALFLALGPHALWLALFVAMNLIQSAFTGFCPAESVLKRLGVTEGGAACSAPEKQGGAA